MADKCLDIQFYKVTELPLIGEPDSVYWLLEGGAVKQYVTTKQGTFLSSPGFAETLTALNKVGSTITYKDETGNTKTIQFSNVAFSGDYNDLINTVARTSELINDGDGVNNFATVDQIPTTIGDLDLDIPIGSSLQFDGGLTHLLKLLDQDLNTMSSVEITPSNIKNLQSYTGLDGRYYTKTQLTEFFNGTTSITGYNKAQWDEAYSWGDHSTAGYLTALSEEDPVFTSSPAGTITTPDINNWNLTYTWGDHSQAGYLTSYSETDPLFQASAAASITTIDKSNWTIAYNTRVTAASFNTSNGDLTITRPGTTNLTTSFDGRYSLIGHNHVISDIIGLQVIVDSIKTKQNLATSFIYGLNLSINTGDNTKFDIAPGAYIVTDFSDVNNGNVVVEVIEYPGAIAVTPAYLLTDPVSYIALDINQNIIQSASPFSNEDRRYLALVGAAVHSNNVIINNTNEIKAPAIAPTNQLHDLIKALGSLNLTGNVISGNGTGLQLAKTAGEIFALGVNAHDFENPHIAVIPAEDPVTFRYRLQDSTEYADTLVIDPLNYDNGGVLTPVTGNNFTIQHINMFQTGQIRIQYGQKLYNTKAEALENIFSDPFVVEKNIAENAIFRAYLIIKREVTNINTAVANGNAHFVTVGKFGNTIGGAGVALTFDNIIDVLGYTPENVANKAINFGTINDILYPTVKAVEDRLAGYAEITGDTFTGPVVVPEEVYSSAWDGSLEVPTKNAVYDKVEQIVAGGADKTFSFVQGVPASTWNVTHNLNKFPSVTVVDSSNSVVIGDVNYIDSNNLTLTFSGAFSGRAELN